MMWSNGLFSNREMQVGEEGRDLPKREEWVSDGAGLTPEARSLVQSTVFSVYDAAFGRILTQEEKQ